MYLVFRAFARKRPGKICGMKQIPQSEPKFHHAEVVDGEGRSVNELLIVWTRGEIFTCWS